MSSEKASIDQRNLFFIDLDGLKIHVYDSSKRRSYRSPLTLIFLHGSPGQISNWKYQISYFEERYRVVAYDQRGYGRSDKPIKVTLNDYLDDLTSLMNKLNISADDAVLVGHSFGGMVAQAYARDHVIKGLVLIGSLIKIKPDIIDKIVWNLPPIFWRRLFFTENLITRKVYRDLFFSPSTSDEIFEEFIRDNREYLESLPAHAFRYMKFFRDYDASDWLPEVRAPTLVIVGEDDKVTPKDESIKIHELLPNSRLVVLEKAGHLVLYERADDLNKLIDEFIEEL